MSETQIDLAHLARLAGLELQPGDDERLRSQLARVLGYVAQLSALELDDGDAPRDDVPRAGARSDEISGTLALEDAMAIAVEREEDFFRVPPVMPDRTS